MAEDLCQTSVLAPAPVHAGESRLQLLDQNGKAINDNQMDAVTPTVPISTAQNTPQQQMTKLRAMAVFIAWITHGMNDAVSGALLPYIESRYNINYTIASLLFVGNAIGFLLAAPFVQKLEHRFGRKFVLPSVAALNVVAYAIIIAQPPFAVVVICFLLNGFVFSANLALNNSFVANMANSNTLMGVMQGGYGLGGTIAPLLATAMVSTGIRWSFFYFISLGLCLINVFLLAWSFRYYRDPQDKSLARPSTAINASEKSLLSRAARDRTTLLGALFIFAYQGAEVTISGWVVSFLIEYRHGDPARVGYVTAGFWAGITLGRFFLCRPIHKLGERLTIPVMIVVWACLHVATWLSRDVVGDAVTVAIMGILTGPISPVVTSVLSRLLNPELQMIGISIGWSVGSGGAALAPFLTGVLSEKLGTVVLNPICIVLCVVMEGAWFGFPSSQWKKQ